MVKRYDFEFYTITPQGDWLLNLIKNTGVLGRRDLLKVLKRDGYKYDRKQKAYFQTNQEFGSSEPLRYAVVIVLYK